MADPIGHGFPAKDGTSGPAIPGYSRVTPNMCLVNNVPPFSGATALVRDTITLITGPVRSKGLILYFDNVAKSNNAIAERESTTEVYSDSGGTLVLARNSVICREEAAVVSGTTLLSVTVTVHVKCDSSSRVWARLSDDAGNQGAGVYVLVGYYD